MADTPLVIGNVANYLQLLNVYGEASFRAKIAEYEAGFDGAVKFYPADEEVKPGKLAENPRFAFLGTSSRLDITNTAAVSSAAGPTSVRGAGPVLSFAPAAPLEFFDHAARGYKKSPEELMAELGQQLGRGAVRFMKQRLYDALRGCVGAQSTGGQHLADYSAVTSKTLTLSRVFAAKQKLGDRGSDARVLLCHSAVAKSLEQDIVAGGNSGGIIRVMIEDGRSVMGGIEKVTSMRLVVDDDLPTVTITSGQVGYKSYLLTDEAAWVWPAPRSPLLTITPPLLDKGARAYKVSVEGHAAVGVGGMHYSSGTMNPANTTLYNSASWAEAFSFDHRDFGIVEIYTVNG